MREAISAMLDGETPGLDPGVVERHAAGCADCRAFREEIAAIRASTQLQPLGDAPDLSGAVVARASRRNRGAVTRLELRLGVALMALGELFASGYLLFSQHGYNAEDHAGHESLSFTVAICVGLMIAAARPAYAAAYVPVIGVAVLLLGTTAAIDLHAGRVAAFEEVPHVDLLIGLYLLWLLARNESGGDPWPRTPVLPRPAPGPGGGLRLVTRIRLLTPRPSLATLRRLLAVGVISASVLVIPAPADAHAVLEGSNPAPDTTLGHAPAAVTLRFDEAVTTLPASLRVFGPDGSRVDNGHVRHPGGYGQKVTVGLNSTSEGTYLVSWRVISADSHPVSGAFTFSVVTHTKAPAVAPTGNDRALAYALGTTRWLGYLGAALLVGGVVFVSVCWPRGWSVRRARVGLLVGAIGVGLATMANLLLKGPYDAALGFGDIWRWSLITEVLDTTFGVGLMIRLGSAAAAIVVLVALRRRPGRLATPVLGVTTAGLLASFPLTGHAATGSPRLLSVGSDLAHVGAMSIWLGGLLMLGFVVIPRRELTETASAASRFSRVAAWSVVVLVATGSYQAWREVGTWASIPATTYGRELLIKIGLVVLVLVAGAASRVWVRRHLTTPVTVPADAARSPSHPAASSAEQSLTRLHRSVGAEALGALVILAVTASLVATQPAKSAYHPTVSANLTLGHDTVQVSGVPAGDRRMALHLYVFDRNSQPTDPAQLTASASLASHQVGPLSLKLRRVDVGHDVGLISVPVTGDWNLSVTLRTSEIDQYTKDVMLPIH